MANLEDLIEMEKLVGVDKDGMKDFLSGNTNKIFYDREVGSTLTYYLPGYLRLRFNSISDIDFENLKADIHCDIAFTLNLKDLPDELIKHVSKNIRFLFANDPEIKVKEAEYVEKEEESDDGGSESENDQEEEEQEQEQEDDEDVEIYFEQQIQKEDGIILTHYLHYHVRKSFKANMVTEMFLTPFEDIDLILMISPRVNPMLVTPQKKKEIEDNKSWGDYPAEFAEKKKKVKTIKFLINLMGIPERKDKMISYGIMRHFGNYSVADKKLNVEYSNESSAREIIIRSKEINKPIHDDEDEDLNLNKIKTFEFGHFIINIYRNPNSVAGTILIPVGLLTIINLGIFFQSNSLAGRIENIAGLMFAYTAIIPVIRSQIPTNPGITFIQIIVYVLTSTTLLCLIEGVIIRNQTGYSPTLNDSFFIASLVMAVLSAVVMICLLIWHHTCRKKSLRSDDQAVSTWEAKFDHRLWKNEDCNNHFIRFFDSGRVRTAKSLKKLDTGSEDRSK